MEARDLLDQLADAISELTYKSCAGGDIEYRFDLHIDTNQLKAALDLLEAQSLAVDNE